MSRKLLGFSWHICVESLEPRRLLAGVELVKDIVPGVDPSLALAFEQHKTVSAKGKFFFEAVDETHGSQVWVSDGTADGTRIMLPKEATQTNADVDDLTAGNGVVYFTAASPFGRQIFQTDGTKAGTIMLTAFSFG